jgi:hypothetical protein
MSYTVEIISQPVSAADNEVLSFLDQIEDNDENGEPSPSVLELYKKVITKYPCITEDSNGPWSDGPLINNFGHPVSILGICSSRAEEVVPWLVKKANEMGFTLYDPQENMIYRPQGASRTDDSPTQEENTKKQWWQFWK